ncbi:MAG TPA: UpxY family transcription antiterminator [Longimicrobiales bacterium]|nr:UpxY family transcription antiterminator [Longimicrobiales bacterium]
MTGSILASILTDAERTPPEQLYTEPHWYACYTRARHEKQVEQLLQQRGFESYLPLIPIMRQWKDRKKRVEFPLFPSYVFGRFTLKEVHGVLTTPGVSTIVRANGYPTPIPERDIANVQKFALAVAETGVEVEQRPFLAEGQWVKVLEGPFEGVEGIVVEQRGRKRVLIGVEAIGQGLEIDIDTRLLKPIRR